jgi:hypothetical protein
MPRHLLAAVAGVAAVAYGAAPAAADPDHDVVVRCDSWRMSGLFVFEGAAHIAGPHVPPTSLTVTCTFLNQVGRYTSTNTAAGPAVVTGGAGPLGAGSMKVCGTAVATYADGHTGTGTYGAC